MYAHIKNSCAYEKNSYLCPELLLKIMASNWLMRLERDARHGVITGSVTRVLYKKGEGRKMYSHPKVGTEVGLSLTATERGCLERLGHAPEFVVRIVGVDVDMEKGEMWLDVEPVSEVVEGPKDMLTEGWWLK